MSLTVFVDSILLINFVDVVCLIYRDYFSRPENGPCMIIVFRVPYQTETASFTRCLPVDNRLTRDVLKESIVKDISDVAGDVADVAVDVQQNENYNLAAVSLLATEFFIATLVGIIVAAKKYCCVRHTCGHPHTERFHGIFRR